jgi:hypothetical protein
MSRGVVVICPAYPNRWEAVSIVKTVTGAKTKEDISEKSKSHEERMTHDIAKVIEPPEEKPAKHL